MRKPAPKNAKELTPKELAELKENALGVLAECRRQLLSPTRQPFIGSIAMNLDIKATRDRRNPTACTDGKSIFFDISFLSELSPEERLFVLGHEVWHNVLGHLTSRKGGTRDHEIYNIALDLEINQILRDEGFTPPKSVCLPQMFNLPDGLSAEEYYECLLKQAKVIQMPGLGNGQGQNGQGHSKNGGKGNGTLNGQFDKHCGVGYDKESDDNGQGQSDKYGAVGEDNDFNPSTSDEDAKKNAERMRELAVAAAQQVERTRGSLPGHIKRLLKELLEPEIPWQEMLIQFVTRAVGDKNSWTRPNRRFVHQGVYLPSKEGEKIKIAVGIDTSGSTACDMKKFLTEVNAIVKDYQNYELHLIQCDTGVKDYTLYNEDNPLDIEHQDFTIHGGGGTTLHPIFDYIKEHELDVDCITIFTDGYIEDMPEADAPEVPTLWVLTGDGNSNAIKFGEILKFNNSVNSEG